METRRLGSIEVSPIGMGCMAFSHGYGEVPTEQYGIEANQPIPGSRNQERILENLGGWNVTLTDDEFQRLDDTLNSLPVHGYRGFEEYEGGTMADWGKKK